MTEFPVDRMAFGQSWPKTFSSNWPKAWSTEKIRSIVKHISGWPKADWPNGGLGYWPKKVPKKVPKTIKQLWASGQTNVSQRNQRNTFFGQSEISTADWPKISQRNQRNTIFGQSEISTADWPKTERSTLRMIILEDTYRTYNLNLRQRCFSNRNNMQFGQWEIWKADWPKNHTILTIQNVHFSHFYTLLQQHIGNIFYAISNLSFKLVFLNLSF